MAKSIFNKSLKFYNRILRSLIFVMVIASGAGVFVMIITTCADVILRRFGIPVTGAYDIVKVSGAITLSLALPYTTAVKGHVAIEYFFHKLSKRARLVVDVIMRMMTMFFFFFLSIRSFIYAGDLYESGQVTATLKIPVFWVPYVISACCFVVVMVILGHIIQPGKEMIRP